MKRISLLALAATLTFAPGLVFAHTGLPANGLAVGFGHPFTGLDHILAMLAVGCWAASLGGAARLVVPAAFVGILMLGAGLGMFGFVLPSVEIGIAASVIVLGLLIAFQVRVPNKVAIWLVGSFALFHGQAHGAEMPAMASPLVYGLGFVAATILLHAAGLALGTLLDTTGRRTLTRIAGASIALCGIALGLVG